MLGETNLIAASVDGGRETVFREGSTMLAKIAFSFLNSCLYQMLPQGFKFHFGILFLELKWDLYGALT